MNRVQRKAAAKKPATVGLHLLQERVQALEGECAQLRNVLFTLIKEAGRVRVSKAVMASLNEQDCLDAVDIGEHYLISFKPASMVVPGGVKDGKPGAA